MAKRRRKAKANPKQDKRVLLAILAVSAIVIITAVVAGLFALCKGVAGMAAFKVRPGEIVLESDWIIPEAALQSFRKTAGDDDNVLSGEFSIFETNLAERVADAFQKSPWVRRVLRVRKVFPNTLDVSLDLREPFAVISSRGKWHCVDQEGMVLSSTVYELTSERLYELKPFIILGHASPPPEKPGTIWDDFSVRAGLSMVDLCRTYLTDKVIIESVDIKGPRDATDTSPTMASLQLSAGPTVEWGRVPSEVASPAEVSTETRISSLLEVVKIEGVNLNRLAFIDVRYSPPVCRE